MMHMTGIMALLVAIAFMLVVFGQIPINDVLVRRISRGAWRSRAYALRYIVTFSVNGFGDTTDRVDPRALGVSASYLGCWRWPAD